MVCRGVPFDVDGLTPSDGVLTFCKELIIHCLGVGKVKVGGILAIIESIKVSIIPNNPKA